METNQEIYQQTTGGGYLEPHRGTMVLVFGILGLLCCGIFAILSWIFGDTDLKKMDQGIMDPSGRDITNVGKILGIVGVCLWILGTLIYLIFFVFAAASGF
jgi:ABC-type Fe3+ transport system permease subunit